MAYGFLVRARGPRVEFALVGDRSGTPARATPARHVSFWDDRLVATIVIGRIYYRGQWSTRLASTTAAAGDAAALVAAVYINQGASALEDLEGDFSAVLVDRIRQRLIAWRDPTGLYPLFWRKLPAAFVVGTSIRALFADDETPHIDPESVADYLSCPDPSLSEMPTQRTAYTSVERVLPGSIVQVALPTQHILVRAFWDWQRRVRSIPVSTLEEAAQVIHDVLLDAVRQRLGQQRTACHFSGGMDSTGIALLAHSLERQRGHEALGVTLSYAVRSLAHEREFVAAAQLSAPSLRLVHVPADGLVDFAGGSQFPVTDEPIGALPGFKAQDAMLETAAAQDADTVLSGDGADHVFSVVRAARARGLLKLALTRLSRPRAAPFEAMRETDVPPWIAGAFAARYAVRTRLLAFAEARLHRRFDAAALAGDWVHWNLAVPRGMVQLKPYLDPRVIVAALGLPRAIYARAAGAKPVLAAALADVLPDKIRHRSTKANFTLKFHGYSEQRDFLTQKVEHLAPLVAGELEPDVLIDCIRQVELGLFADAPSVGRLGAALSYLLWLEDRPCWNKHAPVRSSAAPLNTALPVARRAEPFDSEWDWTS